MITRRHIIQGAAATGLGGVLGGGVAWSAAPAGVRAILPSATHETLAVKVLLDLPSEAAPTLRIDGRAVTPQRMDVDGYAWGFVQSGLRGGTRHMLTLADAAGKPLRAPWPLRTLPAPGTTPERFRILFFTCAGGDEAGSPYGYLPIATRRALFDRALSFAPDLAVANGDHVYWDLWTALKYRRDAATRAKTEAQYRRIAWIDEDTAFDSVTNRRSINTIVGRQIAAIYEDRFASVPLVFVTDDHDYYENDNAGEWGYSLPPRPFIFGLYQRTAAMAHPFALGRPDLGNAWESGTVETVRIGDLLELATYDCRRGWSVGGKDAHVLTTAAERFLTDRLKRSTARHYIHAPSNPFGWTAGKLGEWYADGPSETSTFANDKGYWQPGWFEQHQRLAAALSAQRRPAVSISGDLHASAVSTMTRSGDLDLSANPIHAILPGTIGTAGPGFPSSARGVFPWHPKALEIRDEAKIEERNGFSIVDVFPDRLVVRQFRWRPPEPEAAIAGLAPYSTHTIKRA